MNRAGKNRKSRIVSLPIDEDDFARLEAFARHTSCSRGEVLRRCPHGAHQGGVTVQPYRVPARRGRSGLARHFIESRVIGLGATPG